jgi:hypothetical protein
MCENYPKGVVLVLWPSGKVQRFPDLAKAKTMLMRQHMRYIVCTPDEAGDYADDYPDMVDRWKMDDTIQTRDELWQYLLDISEERDPWAKASLVPDSNRLSKRRTSSGYTLSHKHCVSFADTKNPKQAKVIAKVLHDRFEDGTVVTDDDIEKVLHQATVSGDLKTKQPVKRIFAYYRPVLLEKGVITL